MVRVDKMDTYEILAGDGIENAFKELGIEATRTYKGVMPPDDGMYHGEEYEVWMLSELDYNKITDISEYDWKYAWGWWRSSKGSNICTEPVHKMIVHGHEIEVYYNKERFDSYIENFLEDDYIADFDSCDDAMDALGINYWEDECQYKDFFEYCSKQWGATTERNVCAIAMETAKLNDMLMGELLSLVG